MDHQRNQTRRSLLVASLAVATMLLAVLPASAGPKATQDVVSGQFQTFADGVLRGFDVSGPVRLQRGSGHTSVAANVKGLAPGTTYGSHLHANACDDANGGPHYKDDPAGVVEPPNELWLSFSTNRAGNAHDSSTSAWAVRDGARSVVIHDTDGARIACADLAVG